MENKKELLKSFILAFLVVSSILITFKIAGYKPQYELLGTKQDKEKATQDYNKLQTQSVDLLSPYIIVETNSDYREEAASPFVITKLSNVQAIKNRQFIKSILYIISNSKVEETRFRNKSISEILSIYSKKYTFNYKNYIDTLSSKIIYLGEDNPASNFDFDTVVVLEEKPNNIYLYKKGSEDYFQIEFESNIFSMIQEEFDKNKSLYYKYSIDNRSDIYISSGEDYYIDTYSYESIDISNVAGNIFLRNKNIKSSDRESNFKEITDGYSILREEDNLITYINPSNINNVKNTDYSEVQSKASSFLVSGYLPNSDYSIFNMDKSEISYIEVYREGFVFSKDYSNLIRINVSADGIYNVKYPRKIKKNHLYSERVSGFQLENISAILNFLYYNVDLKNVEDIELGYDKKYTKENTYVYKPNWYIKYKGKYISYLDLKTRVSRGEL